MAADSWKNPQQSTSDFVSALCATDSVLLVGRTSGVVQRYSLPHLTGEPRPTGVAPAHAWPAAAWPLAPDQTVRRPGRPPFCGLVRTGCALAGRLVAVRH